MNKIQCYCCGSERVVELDLYREYRHLKCKDCGFENFIRNESEITASLYENDADYIDDLNVAINSEDLILFGII